MSPGSLQTLRRSVRGRASSWLWALVLALVLPSLWGHWHRVAHAPGLNGAAAALSATVHDGHASGTAECRVLDQAACADGLALLLAAMPVVLAAPPREATVMGPGATARTLAPYAARAPPLDPVV
ncbi:hypothetical protein [Ideonella paludis]|uniref:hypothetical protein n=1 Tax=Ideonella paludis TaxID=1233411 RepID=UPI001B35897D|nr:hypothetical protein [Ideonella paludis]